MSNAPKNLSHFLALMNHSKDCPLGLSESDLSIQNAINAAIKSGNFELAENLRKAKASAEESALNRGNVKIKTRRHKTLISYDEEDKVSLALYNVLLEISQTTKNVLSINKAALLARCLGLRENECKPKLNNGKLDFEIHVRHLGGNTRYTDRQIKELDEQILIDKAKYIKTKHKNRIKRYEKYGLNPNHLKMLQYSTTYLHTGIPELDLEQYFLHGVRQIILKLFNSQNQHEIDIIWKEFRRFVGWVEY